MRRRPWAARLRVALLRAGLRLHMVVLDWRLADAQQRQQILAGHLVADQLVLQQMRAELAGLQVQLAIRELQLADLAGKP